MKKTITLIVFIFGIFTSVAFAQDREWQESIREQADSAADGMTVVTNGGNADDGWANDVRLSAEEANDLSDDSTLAVSEEVDDLPTDSVVAASEEEVEVSQAPKPQTKKKGKLVFPYRRFVEFGVNGSVGLSNNFAGLSDILRKNIMLDMSELADRIKTDGWNINMNVNADVFFNFNISPRWGFGFSSSVSGDINATLSKSLMTLLAKGNISNPSQSGGVSVSGGVFTDVGLDMHGRFLKDNKLKVSLIPSMFVPVVYIPKSGITYQLNAHDALTVTAGGKIEVFTPIYTESIVENSSFNMDVLNINSILGQRGFDFTLTAEYDLFPWLNVGGGFTHIPLSPAVLENRMSATLPNGVIIDGSGLIEGATDNLINIPDLEIVYDKKNLKIIRPMRFDIYADYKPFNRNLFIIRPNIGFTVFTPEDKARFNATLGVSLNTPVLLIHASSGYDELLWKHKLWLGLNLRVIEIDVGLHLSSQDFKQSFDMSGAGITVGVKLGF
ncbi:MAG: hypothetical protein LBH75_06725 [Treponema sp.]|jgi:hypothetical protein|nr:hypothetical protein [Treponema sp.]